jgi:hypothetical protein
MAHMVPEWNDMFRSVGFLSLYLALIDVPVPGSQVVYVAGVCLSQPSLSRIRRRDGEDRRWRRPRY